MSVWRGRKRLPFSAAFLMTDLKRLWYFLLQDVSLYPLYLNVFVTYQDLKKEQKPYLKTTQASLEAVVVQMTLFLITWVPFRKKFSRAEPDLQVYRRWNLQCYVRKQTRPSEEDKNTHNWDRRNNSMVTTRFYITKTRNLSLSLWHILLNIHLL